LSEKRAIVRLFFVVEEIEGNARVGKSANRENNAVEIYGMSKKCTTMKRARFAVFPILFPTVLIYCYNLLDLLIFAYFSLNREDRYKDL